LKNLFIT
jgi:hypothetical protein